ncbi:MAG: hypothetical protein ABSH07_13050 [Candidatus Dormibacteria bacterium]
MSTFRCPNCAAPGAIVHAGTDFAMSDTGDAIVIEGTAHAWDWLGDLAPARCRQCGHQGQLIEWQIPMEPVPRHWMVTVVVLPVGAPDVLIVPQGAERHVGPFTSKEDGEAWITQHRDGGPELMFIRPPAPPGTVFTLTELESPIVLMG